MAQAGRPTKYEESVKSRFDEIIQWAEAGATDKEIAENLGIHRSTLIEYKKEYSEFADLLKNARKKPVTKIKASLLQRALGFEYEERKTVIRAFQLPEEAQEILKEHHYKFDTEPKVVKTEIVTKYAPPSEAAALILLQHWAKSEGWTRDPQSLALKKKELKLKEKLAKENSW